MNLFKQRRARLYNGTEVKEGDKIAFINSDGERCEGLIKRRKKECFEKEEKEAAYKSKTTILDAKKAQLNGLQSIFKVIN